MSATGTRALLSHIFGVGDCVTSDVRTSGELCAVMKAKLLLNGQ